MREGLPLKTASITYNPLQRVWLGEFWVDMKSIVVGVVGKERDLLFSDFLIKLAGRRGELLFTKPFCMIAGLDELVWARTMVAWPLAHDERFSGINAEQQFPLLWGSLLAEVDETLRANEDVVREVADLLMTHGKADASRLAAIAAKVPKRGAPFAVRSQAELQAFDWVNDPLA
jgi:hypothetical protein